MQNRSFSFVSGLVVAAAVIASIFVTPAAAKKKPPPPPPPPPLSTSNIYATSYGDVLDGNRCGVTPEDVQATADGGSIALAHSDCREVTWLVKADAFGNPQWQEEVGCLNLPPGGYALGVAVQQTSDGGYVLGGGTRDCDESPICPYLTSQQCGLIQKLDSSGKLIWSRVYSASARDTSIWGIKQTSDGGYVAAGTFTDENGDIGSFILKVDGVGKAQWETTIGPSGPTHALLNDVVQTADGGYAAAGHSYTTSADSPYPTSVLVVRLDANGNVRWQRGFNSFDGSGAANAGEQVESIIKTSDGGYLVAGHWRTIGPQTCCQGPFLLKLGGSGDIQWQKAYSGGVYCYSDGYSTRCAAIGGLAYSVRQVPDGGYIVAGAGHLKLLDSVPLVPALGKVDASGNLLWQHFYYELSAANRTLSEYFASSAVTSDGGNLAVGFTENEAAGYTGELFAVRTDSAGLAGACSVVHQATPLDAIDPGLVAVAPALPVRATLPAQADLPGRTQPTSISTRGGGC
jgi:hypothetical protein